VYVYYVNDTLAFIANNGTLTNNTEEEIVLEPGLTLLDGNTTYKIIVNVTDAGNNNATSNILFYNLFAPSIELVSPENNYLDTDGNISFSFKVYAGAYTNITCSIYIDNVLNQTNNETVTGGNLTTFNLTGIGDGLNREWKIYCIDPENNTGEDTRSFSVDTSGPVINWINDTPDPVDPGNIINFTANITDLSSISALIEINSQNFSMFQSGDIFYYDVLDTFIVAGTYDYRIFANDTNGFEATPLLGNFTVNTLISLQLFNTPINFSSVSPGVLANALSLYGWPLVVKNTGNVEENLSIQGTDMIGIVDSGESIAKINVKWDLNSSFLDSNNLSASDQYVTNLPMAENDSLYFKLNVPNYLQSQAYQGNVTLTATLS